MDMLNVFKVDVSLFNSIFSDIIHGHSMRLWGNGVFQVVKITKKYYYVSNVFLAVPSIDSKRRKIPREDFDLFLSDASSNRFVTFLSDEEVVKILLQSK